MLKNEVLYILEQQRGNIVTGGQLAQKLGVSRTAVWKAVHALREDGNEIVAIPNVGYRLLETNDTLSQQRISEELSTGFIGRNLTLLPWVHSTNQYLKEQDALSLPGGFVVAADEQLKGRGRKSRAFLSPKGQGVYFSILLKTDGRSHDIRLLTICAAVAVSKAVETVGGMRAEIKWVNDIFLGGKKVCGILTEAVLSGELQELDTVILGIGINTGDVPHELEDIATSIQRETGKRGIRNQLIAQVLNQFEEIYLDYTGRGKALEILKYYESRLFIIGRRVFVHDRQDAYAATVLGIDSGGALIVKTEAGATRHITTGEIKLT